MAKTHDCPVCGRKIERVAHRAVHRGEAPYRWRHEGVPDWLDWIDEADDDGRPAHPERMLRAWHQDT